MEKTYLLESFRCPECKTVLSDVYVNKEEVSELYKKTSRPVPIPVVCKNGHNLILFVYINNDKVRIRTILPAGKAIKNGKIVLADDKKKDEAIKWFTEW